MLGLIKKKTVLDKKYLKHHEEHALLLFVAGIILGVGLSTYIWGNQVYAMLSAITILVIAYFIENRMIE